MSTNAGARKMTESETITMNVSGMSCQHCVNAVKEKLSALAGVDTVEVTLKPGQAVVTGKGLDKAALRTAVEELGFDAE